MPETNPDYVTKLDPDGQGTLYLVAISLMLCAVVALVGILRGPEIATDPHLEPSPSPSPSSSAWSDECTAEDLDDGMCLTYDDIRDLEWHSEAP